MRVSIICGLLALADQTSQYNSERTSLVHANHTMPDLPGLSFNLYRKRINETSKNKRTVLIVKKTRDDNFNYYIDFNMGNPPQHIEAKLSTKHRGFYIVSGQQPGYSISDFVYSLWHVRPRDGVFNSFRSKTFGRVSNLFPTTSLFYGPNWAGYAEDDIFLGTSVLDKGKFMIMQESTEPAMIGLGASGQTSDSISEDHKDEETTNIFKQMKSRGWSLKAAYSIWIGKESSEYTGIIMFNSVNHHFAASEIYRFPLVKPRNRKGYYIMLDAINIQGLDGTSTEVVRLSAPIELNFEMPYSTFPLEIVRLFYVNYFTMQNRPFKVSCRNELERGALGLVFSGVEYIFKYEDILLDYQQGEEQCAPPFYPGRSIILGANFLSTLYMIFDLDVGEVGLAFARTDVKPPVTGIEPIVSSIPGKMAPNYSSTKFSSTYSIVGTRPFSNREYITVRLDT